MNVLFFFGTFFGFCEKVFSNSSDQEKLLKFEAEGQEFAKCLRSLEQFFQTVKGKDNIW